LCQDLVEQFIRQDALWIESLPRLVELGQREAGLQAPLYRGCGGVKRGDGGVKVNVR
jgi:hypothetical protein